MVPRIDELLSRAGNRDMIFSKQVPGFSSLWEKYAYDRLTFLRDDGGLLTLSELQKSVDKFVIHEALLGSVVKKSLKDVKEIKLNSTHEKAFYDEDSKTVHIAQPASDRRSKRFVDMIYLGCVLPDNNWDVDFEVVPYQSSKLETKLKYSDNAYDFVRDLSMNHNNLRDVNHVLIGRLDWLLKNSELDFLETNENEYLDSAIAYTENNEQVLCLDYVFGDQMKHLIQHLMLTFDGETPDDEKRKVSVVMYGKAGGIRNQEIGDVVTPNGIVNSSSVENGKRGFTRIDNSIWIGTGPDQFNYILNETSVPLQRKSILREGLNRGCSVVEMEALNGTHEINCARDQYPVLDIEHGIVHFISDLPLNGITLANNSQYNVGIKNMVRVIDQYLNSK